MRDKKKMIVVGAVVLIIIIVLVVVFVFAKKSFGKTLGTQQVEGTDRMGIDYGGDFNEFEYQSEENEIVAEEQTETVDVDELKELDKKQQEEFEKNKANGLITGDENSSNFAVTKGEWGQSVSEQEQTENSEPVEESTEESAEEADEEYVGDGEDIAVQIFSSNGYAEYEVLCDVASQEEAESIAAQIGGNVAECQNGVALIKITENVDELLARLEQQGSSLKLYRNYNISMQ